MASSKDNLYNRTMDGAGETLLPTASDEGADIVMSYDGLMD